MIDWIHHIVMVVVMLPMAWVMQPGPLLGHGAFWASGLPGGLDYVMLVMVKKGWLDSLTEKRINGQIMVWIRCPGCLYHALFCWLAMSDVARRKEAGETMLLPFSPLPQTSFYVNMCLGVVLTTFFWNGLYFMERVVANHAVRAAEQRLKAKNAK
jgi:hypothetical protein